MALTYVGIAIGRWPKIKSNRATIALMGCGLLLVTGQVAFKDLPGLLDFDTLILLFSMMIINANLRHAHLTLVLLMRNCVEGFHQDEQVNLLISLATG